MINGGFDIGNGYVKGLIKNPDIDKKAVPIDMPSAAAVITNSADVRISEPDAVRKEMDDIYNKLEVSFDSPLIDDKEIHMYVGKRAVKSGKSLQEFNLREARRSKSETELSAILTLSMLAGKGLQDFYNEHGKLPEKDQVLTVNAKIAVSLPIEEYKLNRQIVERNYVAKSHLVRIHNFQNVIRVDIHVKEVQVAPEGAAAQFAIAAKGEKLMKALIANMEAHGVKLPEGITAKDIAAAGGIIGIDIGEGTVNFPIYQNCVFNQDTSSTFQKGYGNVMDEALYRLAQMGRPFDSRKKLVEWLLEAKDKPLMRAKYQEAMSVVEAEVNIFTTELQKQFATVLDRNGAFAEVVYVFGGGATPVQESLYPKLVKSIQRTFGENAFTPVLYLDSSYSRYLNRDGLYILASSDKTKSVEDLNALYVDN